MRIINFRCDKSLSYPLYENCKQGDDLKLIFSMYDNGNSISLNGNNVTLKLIRNDGTIHIQNTNISILNNVITVECYRKDNNLVTQCNGKIKIELLIENTQGIFFNTFNATITCRSSVFAKDESRHTNTLVETLDNCIKNTNTAISEATKAINDSIIAKNNIKNETTNCINNIENVIETNQVATKGELTTINDKIVNYEYLPQSPMPPKQTTISSNMKIVQKTDNQTITVIQKTNKGYMKYIFNDKYCVPSDSSNYGGTAELVRLIDARNMVNCCVWLDVANPTTGTVNQYTAPSINTNVLEASLMDLTDKQDNRSISSKAGNLGFGIYSITYNNSVEYTMKHTMNPKANLCYMGTSGSVSEVNIYVDGQIVKTFNPKQFVNGATVYGLVEFDVPTKPQSTTYTLKIEAKGVAGTFYFGAINFYELKNYNNQYVDNWKGFGSTNGLSYVTTGANDYAMADENSKWFGSYHGGETLNSFQILWINTNAYLKRESDLTYVSFSDIPVGEWKIFNNQFNMRLRTTLLGKAYMNTCYDFSEDGTINMNFCLENNSENPIKFNAFFTALTCTSPSFNIVDLPQYINLGTTPPSTSREIPLYINNGFASQIDTTNKLQLNIRFTKLNYENNKRGCYILDATYYRKFYYGVVTNTRNVIIPNLQFSKALDFLVR